MIKKPSSGWKKRFRPIFPGNTWDAVENTIIWKKLFYQMKRFSGLLILFYGVIKLKNLTEQFITAHFVSWPFLCNVYLHLVIFCEADGNFLLKMLYCPWFWSVFSRITEYTSGSNSSGSKKDSNNYFANYKIFSVTTEWMLKTKIFEKKLPFQWKSNFDLFSCNTEFCRQP